MIDEDVIFGLVRAAQDQQAVVERATKAMDAQRGELYGAIAQLKNVRASVATEARQGAEQGISGIGAEVNTSLRVEVNKAKATLGDLIDELRGTAWALSWRWTLGLLVAGLLFGLALGWILWGMNISDRLDAIEQTLQSQAVPSMPVAPPRLHKRTR